MKDAIVSVQVPSPLTGRYEKYFRVVANGSSDDALRAALETIIADRSGALVHEPVKPHKKVRKERD